MPSLFTSRERTKRSEFYKESLRIKKLNKKATVDECFDEYRKNKELNNINFESLGHAYSCFCTSVILNSIFKSNIGSDLKYWVDQPGDGGIDGIAFSIDGECVQDIRFESRKQKIRNIDMYFIQAKYHKKFNSKSLSEEYDKFRKGLLSFISEREILERNPCYSMKQWIIILNALIHTISNEKKYSINDRPKINVHIIFAIKSDNNCPVDIIDANKKFENHLIEETEGSINSIEFLWLTGRELAKKYNLYKKNLIEEEKNKKQGKSIKLGFKKINGINIKGDETWIPESIIFKRNRKISIPDLIVCDHEVTIREYDEIMVFHHNRYGVLHQINDDEDRKNEPVTCINWYEALAYCNILSLKEKLMPCYIICGTTDPDYWQIPNETFDDWNESVICNFKADGYRLPTEAEWEWLARGGENYIYAGSDNYDDVAWCKYNTKHVWPYVRDVMTLKGNGYGLYDMSGNVQEWCWDSDFVGGKTGRIIRGGSVALAPDFCTVFKSDSTLPNCIGSSLGFRVVRTSI